METLVSVLALSATQRLAFLVQMVVACKFSILFKTSRFNFFSSIFNKKGAIRQVILIQWLPHQYAVLFLYLNLTLLFYLEY
jgi:hypothetical protein